jgi:hypothetical protein
VQVLQLLVHQFVTSQLYRLVMLLPELVLGVVRVSLAGPLKHPQHPLLPALLAVFGNGFYPLTLKCRFYSISPLMVDLFLYQRYRKAKAMETPAAFITQLGTALKQLFTQEVHLTYIREYGIGWEELMDGSLAPPAQGARFDIGFEGKLSGDTLRGGISGIDYLAVRADGQYQLNGYATIITHDGETIAFHEAGTLMPNVAGLAQVCLNMHFSTASANYQWLNQKLAWGFGAIDLRKGFLNIRAFTTDFSL